MTDHQDNALSNRILSFMLGIIVGMAIMFIRGMM
jgi:capsular polysaccharide biosynthesis protein